MSVAPPRTVLATTGLPWCHVCAPPYTVLKPSTTRLLRLALLAVRFSLPWFFLPWTNQTHASSLNNLFNAKLFIFVQSEFLIYYTYQWGTGAPAVNFFNANHHDTCTLLHTRVYRHTCLREKNCSSYNRPKESRFRLRHFASRERERQTTDTYVNYI
ncbi:hypothetical protein CPB86DRAFT_277507 [Serendipita vermifera]|nr:hypothetical protein CPB86DRAFT_277507 [Serendipita vermifera]